LAAALLLCWTTSVRAADAAAQDKPAASGPRKIVLIAGPKDEHHGPGTHEYENTVKTIKEALEASNVADQVKVETVLNGWPEDPAILDDADTIFLVSAGADHKESDHPFLADDRMKVLARQMDRGCGLVMLHWSVFVPIKYEKQFSEWLGGFFDYQRGDDPRGWYSAITFATAKVQPNAKHPIGKGVPPFEQRDEYYYKIRFGEKDERLTPIITVKLPEVEEPQVVAWAVERKNGGRGFAFTGGHFQKSWEEDAYRTLMLNAICWTAKVKLPAGGVHKQLAFDDQWTPKPHLGKEDLPKETEEDWVDGRFRETDVGPYFTASIVAPSLADPDAARTVPVDDRKLPHNPNMVVKALAIKLGGKDGTPPSAVLFDKEKMVLRCGWTGGFLNFSDRRFGLLEMPTIAGDVAWSTATRNHWLMSPAGNNAFEEGQMAPAEVKYEGLHLNGERTILAYDVAGCPVLESPSIETFGEITAFVRTFEFGPTNRELRLSLANWPGAAVPSAKEPSEIVSPHLSKDGKALAVQVLGTPGHETSVATSLPSPGNSSITLSVFPSMETQSAAVVVWTGPEEKLNDFRDEMEKNPSASVLSELIHDPVSRWGQPLVTRGEVGTPQPGSAFAVDTVAIPYENPFKALFFMGGFDFAPDGTCYACTAHGDVWKITGIDDDLDEIRWQRFATGLYEPLGLKIRDGEIFILGRDQITRLHDENGDGEADFYENFNDDLTDLGQAHAYAMCLETDSHGNFYFLKSGAPETPHGGTLLKLSADGKNLEVYATGFRHPNGLGIGPDDTITTADNEGNWTPVTRVDIVEKGEFCGHVPTAHTATEPTDPGQPLCWLPRVIDNSAGGQAWVPPGEWGPLAGSMLHLSFGTCTANLILKEQVDGAWQGGAMRLPIPPFLSGVCRGRFRTSGEGADGHLYVCGLDGWQTNATRDGCLQRVRYVGGKLLLPTELHAYANGVELAFAEPLDPELASNPARYAIDMWNYRWSQDYGSKDYSAADPTKEGRDSVPVKSATLSADGKRVFLGVEGLKPVMQLRVQAGLKTADGVELPVDYYGTVHQVRPAESGKKAVAKALPAAK
jgi:type 1 glutamine amidotransferase